MWGQVSVLVCGMLDIWDHPHACGDKSIYDVKSIGEFGSSPRVWGQGNMLCISPRGDRIIPTRVGTRRLCLLPWSRTRDHPHACGDKKTRVLNANNSSGSSPRVWGQVKSNGVIPPSERIIPTRVGTSNKKFARENATGDHPHACGDKKVRDTLFNSTLGSSPRVWGQGA